MEYATAILLWNIEVLKPHCFWCNKVWRRIRHKKRWNDSKANEVQLHGFERQLIIFILICIIVIRTVVICKKIQQRNTGVRSVLVKVLQENWQLQ